MSDPGKGKSVGARTRAAAREARRRKGGKCGPRLARPVQPSGRFFPLFRGARSGTTRFPLPRSLMACLNFLLLFPHSFTLFLLSNSHG